MRIVRDFSLALCLGLTGLSAIGAPLAPNGPLVPSSAMLRQVILKGDVAEPDGVFGKSTVGLVRDEKSANDGASMRRLECTATILSDRYVLTAGHCLDEDDVPPSDWRLAFSDGERSFERQLKRVVLHPSYHKARSGETYQTHPERTRFDLALAEFDGGLPQGFVPARWLDDWSQVRGGAAYTIAGLGYFKAYSDAQDFRLRTARFEMGFDMDDGPVDRNSWVIFSYLNSTGASVCPGDSGSPAYIMKDGRPLLWGITTSGVGAEPGGGCGTFFGHYNLNLFHHLEWIRSEMRL